VSTGTPFALDDNQEEVDSEMENFGVERVLKLKSFNKISMYSRHLLSVLRTSQICYEMGEKKTGQGPNFV